MQYGTVTVNGQQYVERVQIFPAELTVMNNNQEFTGLRLALPGVANFLLKGLTRETTVNGVSSARRFLFRLGNSDGMTWYSAGGLGNPTQRVIDSLTFGTGQFPYPLLPPVNYSAGGSIMYEVQDISGAAPYTIYFAFHGSYLIPLGS